MGMEGLMNLDSGSLNTNSVSLSPSKVQKPKGLETNNFENNDPAGDITDVWARGVGSEDDGGVKVSHSKKVIKHALKQQAKRRRKNTNIAAGCSSAPRLQAHGSPSELDEVNVNIGVCYRQPTMAEVLSSIPGFNLKPRKRSNKKLSAAAQLEQTKEGCVDLETPDSILVNSNLRQLMNKHTFSSLPPLYQYKLLQLLPHVDRTLGHSDYVYRLSPTGLNNEFFARACMDWRERLTEGEFTPENQAKIKADQEKEKTKLDPWKLKHFEPMWGECLEEWPSVPPGVLERCGSASVSANINNIPGCASIQEQSTAPPLKKKRGSGGNNKPPAPPPPPRPVRTVGAVTRAQSSYREKRQAELTTQQNHKKSKPAEDEVVIETTIITEDVVVVSDEKVLESSTEDEIIQIEVCTTPIKSVKSLPKSPVPSVQSPLRVSSPSPVKSPLPKSPIRLCKSPSPSIRSPTPKSPISGIASPVPLSRSPARPGRSPTPSSKSPINVRSPVSSSKSPMRVASPLVSTKSPIISPKGTDLFVDKSPVRTDSPSFIENDDLSSDVTSELPLDKVKSPEPHLIYQVEDSEDTQTDKLEDNTQVETSNKPSPVIPEAVPNETSVSVSSIETTIVYSVSNCSSDISFTDKRDCEISEVSCSTENLEPTFESLESNSILVGEGMSNTESDTRQTGESPKSSKIEETLEKPDEEDWEIIKVDPNSSETLQDDQVSGLCSNEGSNLSCVTTNTEPDKLDEASKCSSYNTEESYNATDVLLYQDGLKDDEAALLAAAWDAVGSTTTDKILRDIQNQHQQLNTIVPGEVSVIPCQEELEVRLEETSLPAWDVVTSQPQDSQPSQQHSHVKLELEVTLTPEVDSQVSSSTVDGGSSSSRKEVGLCQPVIPPTTIVCLPPANAPSIVVQPQHHHGTSLPPPPTLQQPSIPASSSALPYIALTTSTPVRALPTKTLTKNSNIGSVGRTSRNITNKPPPGAINLERSYQICQAVIQNSPNRDQLQGQLKPPPGLRPGGHRMAVRAANSSTQGVRYSAGGPRTKPQQVLLKQVFTSQHHGIPVNMAVLPNSPHHINNNHQMSEYVIMRSGGLRRSNSAPPGGGSGGRLVGTAPRPASTAAPPQTTADCLCSLKPMQACLKCGAFCHQDCISPSRLCITCFTQ